MKNVSFECSPLELSTNYESSICMFFKNVKIKIESQHLSMLFEKIQFLWFYEQIRWRHLTFFFWKFNLVIWQVFIKNGFLPQYALHSKICISSKIRFFFGNFQILRSGMIFGDFYSLIFYLPNDVFRSKPILSLWCM